MVTAILSALVLGAIYALVAQGYNIVLLASRAFNFAHAAVVTLGSFLASEFGVQYGLPLPAVIVLAGLAGGAIGLVLEFIAIRPVAGRGSHGELVTTLGASTALIGVVILVWGDDIRHVNDIVSADLVNVVGGQVTVDGLILIAVAVGLTVALWAWSRFTIGGLACLASAENREAATLRGINVRRLSLGAMVAAGVLAGVSGQLVATQTLAVVTVATVITVKSFLAVAIGGFGSFQGALIGAFVVGLTESLSSRYLGGSYSIFILFAMLLLILLVMPRGIFGRAAERMV